MDGAADPEDVAELAPVDLGDFGGPEGEGQEGLAGRRGPQPRARRPGARVIPPR